MSNEKTVPHTSVPPESTPAQAHEPVRSPFAGCLILSLAAIIVLGLAFFAWWTVDQQAKEISKFTETKADPVEMLVPEEHQTELNTLVAKLQHFRHEVENKRASQLDLSTGDLNLAIASFDEGMQLRHTFFISKMTPEHLFADISFKLGSSPFSDRENHLNAKLVTTPALTNGHIYLEVKKIIPSIGTVPNPFREHLSPYLITEMYLEHPQIGPIMKALTGMHLTDDQISLIYDPQATPPSAQMEAAEGVKQTRNFMALVAIIVILTMILLFVILAKRRQLKKAALAK